jgi:uncharacterized protein YqhQ
MLIFLWSHNFTKHARLSLEHAAPGWAAGEGARMKGQETDMQAHERDGETDMQAHQREKHKKWNIKCPELRGLFIFPSCANIPN